MKKVKEHIFIIGQCTLHWGRMQFGNIGNYYIIEPFFEEIRRVFPDAELTTTMQFTEPFCKKYNIKTIPMEAYYDFNSDNNLALAQAELYALENNLNNNSIYIDEVKKASFVIDFSGDIWGDNADFLAKDRFAVGCYKDLVAQKLKPTIMLAGSPGPFKSKENMDLAKKTYAGFTFVTNREPISTRLLTQWGFDMTHTLNFPCPSFLFNPADSKETYQYCKNSELWETETLKVGFILCGWNFKKGPYDLAERNDNEYENFVTIIKHLIEIHHAHIFLLSHSNGFKIPPNKFELIHGRDYPIVKQLYNILCTKGFESNVTLLDGIYPPDITKGIISNFDILISGRMHGAVAGLSQGIPTVIIDYGHEPKAHKLQGFAEVADVKNYIADPNNLKELENVITTCIRNKQSIHQALTQNMRTIKAKARYQFDLIKDYIL